MRFYKILLSGLLLVVVSLVVIISLYFARVNLITKAVNHFLSDSNAQIDCLAVDINTLYQVTLSELCLTSPLARIKLRNVTLDWHQNAPMVINDIAIEHATIIGTADLPTPASAPAKTAPVNQPLDLVKIKAKANQQLAELLAFTLPVSLQIEAFNYQPYRNENGEVATQKNKLSFTGNLHATNNKLDFSLTNAEQAPILSTRLTKSSAQLAGNASANIAADLSLELSALPALLKTHNINTLTAIPAINGLVSAQLQWQQDKLEFNSDLTDVEVAIVNPAEKMNLQIKVDTKFSGSISPEKVAINLAPSSKIAIKSDEKTLQPYLNQQNLPKPLQQLLRDNPLDNLSIMPSGNILFTVKDNQLLLEHLAIKNQSNAHHVAITLNDLSATINTDFNSSPVSTLARSHNDFLIESRIKVAALADFSNAPITSQFAGSVKYTPELVSVKLTPRTQVSLNNLQFSQTATEQAKAAIYQAKRAQLKVNGSFSLQPQQPATSLKAELSVQPSLTKVQVANLAQFERIEIKSALALNGDKINLTALPTIDQVALGELAIFGNINQPKINLVANQLLLNDLLALNVKVPVEVKLIDGQLSYQLQGQFNQLSPIDFSPMTLTTQIENITGEIDGIWIESLQVSHTALISPNGFYSEKTHKPNITLDKVELATPLTNIALHSQISFADNALAVIATDISTDIFGGNVKLPKLEWPLVDNKPLFLQLNRIDLEQVLALDKKQGIVVTGKISGQLPASINQDKITITAGELYNVEPGLIQVINNPVAENLKASNSQLQLAFDALQNLHYHQLTSDVSMDESGYMLLKSVIKGRNNELDNDVNLNLNIDYDLLGLLESISITETFEHQIIKGLQKK